MSGLDDPTRRAPMDIWAMSGQHPSRRHDEMLAERLRFLAAMPDTRPHRVRGLVIRLQTMWSRPTARERLPEASRRALGKPVGT